MEILNNVFFFNLYTNKIFEIILKITELYLNIFFYETSNLIMFQDGKNTNSTGVEIKVADVQNSPPEFLDSLTGVVKEDDPIGTLVMTIKARDGDRGMPQKIIYELVSSKPVTS